MAAPHATRAVVFDWDGTMDDIIPTWHKLAVILLTKWLKRKSPPFYPTPAALKQAVDRLGVSGSLGPYLTKEEWDVAIEKHRAEYDAITGEPCPLYPDTVPSIIRLLDAEFDLALISRADEARLRPAIKRLERALVAAGRSCEDYSAPESREGAEGAEGTRESFWPFRSVLFGSETKEIRIRHLLASNPSWQSVYYIGDLCIDVYACYHAFPDTRRIIPISISRALQSPAALSAISLTYPTMEAAIDRILTNELVKVPIVLSGSRVAVIDLVGVLLDSFENIFTQLSFVASHLGPMARKRFPKAAADLRRALDDEGRAAIERYISPSDFERVMAEHASEWSAIEKGLEVKPVSDARRSILTLRDRRFTIFIVTDRAHEAIAYSTLRSIRADKLVTEVVLDRSDVLDAVGARAESLRHVACGMTYYVCDSTNDVAACYRAFPDTRRIVPVTVATGIGGKKELAQISFHFDTLSDAVDALCDDRLW